MISKEERDTYREKLTRRAVNTGWISIENTLRLLDSLDESESARESAEASCAAMREAAIPLAHFIDMLDDKPLNGTGDRLYGIHMGTQWEAEITATTLHKLKSALSSAAGTALLERLRKAEDEVAFLRPFYKKVEDEAFAHMPEHDDSLDCIH